MTEGGLEMGKRISFIGCLLLGICCFGMTVFAADEQSAEENEEQSNALVELWNIRGERMGKESMEQKS